MNVSLGGHLEEVVNEMVKSGRFASASEVMREGIRLVEEREEKLKWLRDKVDRSIARGGRHSTEEVRIAVFAALDDWEQQQGSDG